MMELKNLQSESDCSEATKIKTPFAHIIVGGTSENPYYSIMWYGSDGYLHIGYGSSCLEYVFKWLSEEFEVIEAPTIDAVEVVRCKECKYWDKATIRKGFLICLASGMEIMADDYCSYGKRKE